MGRVVIVFFDDAAMAEYKSLVEYEKIEYDL